MQRAQDIEEIIEGFKVMRQQLRFAAEDVSQWTLSHSQWLALSVIARKEAVTVGKLRAALGVSSSAATQLANSLEKKQHIVRAADKTDGRVSVLVLTSQTKQAFATVRVKRLDEYGKLFAALNAEEFAQYLKLHRKLINSIS